MDDHGTPGGAIGASAPSIATPLLELSGLTKWFGAVHALTDVSLTVPRGEVHALVGENGAGKSTLVKLLMGVHSPDAGQIKLNGRECTFATPRDALAAGIAGMAQEISLAGQRSVMENVFLGREPDTLGFVRRGTLRSKFEALAERAEFSISPDVRAGSLSIADQQSVELLRALSRDARVIVMDEPTAAISRAESEKLFRIVRRLRDDGVVVLYISHYLDEVLELADRITILRDGRLVRTAPAEGESAETLIRSMLGRPLDQVFPPKSSPDQARPPMLSVRNLTRDDVFRDISFDVRPGEIVGLAGLVGSGRTEIARAIFGAEPPDGGTVALDGRNVRIRSPRDAIRAGIVYLTESRKDDGLFLGRSAVENVALPHLGKVSRYGIVSGGREVKMCLSTLESVNTTHANSRGPVRLLSGGNQQKVLFARWLVSPPAVFIADEPTRGVDIGARAAIYALLEEMAKKGTAIVLISSEHEELIGMAHRVLVIRLGQLVAELGADDITEANIVSAALTD